MRATGKRVAIVGAGPAGLACADALARRGIEAHVFDRYEEIGGLLTFGIPPFKLEKHVVATRRGVLEHMGVRFELGCEVDAARFGELERDFDSMFLATGAYAYVEAQLPGIDLDGVVPALPFLVANARREEKLLIGRAQDLRCARRPSRSRHLRVRSSQRGALPLH